MSRFACSRWLCARVACVIHCPFVKLLLTLSRLPRMRMKQHVACGSAEAHPWPGCRHNEKCVSAWHPIVCTPHIHRQVFIDQNSGDGPQRRATLRLVLDRHPGGWAEVEVTVAAGRKC